MMLVDEDVEGEDVFEGGEGEVLVEEAIHGAIVDGKHSDGLAAVYLADEVGEGDVVIEGGEAWNICYIVTVPEAFTSSNK
ncbi:uncharacterized protein HKW66_Vig0238880 [Vigna angularis]|uniref:Uncharacterized protein n=1 Tax=Phaseolus angularis TaxID=3914 RepID=A0A8T0KTB4_PHAAN|nr:uncharacterized protein HKW66_Vig0238880 [Vigna angularis]